MLSLPIVVGVAGMAIGASAGQRRGTTEIEVFKTPTCGCCLLWVEHLRAAGFRVRVNDMNDLSKLKASHGVPGQLQSCHTGVVDGYVIEGHVPATDIRRLLETRPSVAGLAVPGMPIGSPGMEVQGVKPRPFDVMAFDKQGKAIVFASHNKQVPSLVP
jgi:hypothetical protein